MATGTITPALYLSGPGILYTAPLLTALPSNTPTAGLFPTAAFGGAWLPVGSTADGITFKDAVSTDNMEAAESYYPVRIITTGRAGTAEVGLQEINKTNLTKALNGGTVTSTGSAGTTLTQIDPPTVGAETRVMWGWQSEDNTVRFFAYQVLQTGSIDMKMTKGANPAALALTLSFELPPTGPVYSIFLAGTTRAA